MKKLRKFLRTQRNNRERTILILFDLKQYRQAIYPVWRQKKLLKANNIEKQPDKLQESPGIVHNAMSLGLCLLIACIMLIGGCQGFAHAYSDEKYVNAIYMAEGGNHATYLYGIRSIHYSSNTQARRICLQTVTNNKRRYKRIGYKHYPRFIDYLASRYCPITGRNLSQSEKRLNKNWVKNVTYWLKKGHHAKIS